MGRGKNVCSDDLGHMTKMAALPYMVKTLQKVFFSGTKGLMTLWLGMEHWGLWPIIVCSNDEPRLTMTYFTAMSNLVSYAFIWGKLLESNLMEETYSKLVLVFMKHYALNSLPVTVNSHHVLCKNFQRAITPEK